MKVENIDVNKTIQSARDALDNETNFSETVTRVFSSLIDVTVILANRLTLTSRNSSKPPSTDNNNNRNNTDKKKGKRKRGGQQGHKGATLEPVDNPDEVKIIHVDRRTLPRGSEYTPDGYAVRQVFNVKISKFVTEYRAEQLVNQDGQVFGASFPKDVTHRTQYGASVKARAVYFSIEQMIPYERIQEQFKHDADLSGYSCEREHPLSLIVNTRS